LGERLIRERSRLGFDMTCEQQVFATLAYFGGSSFMRVVGDFLGFRKSSISGAVKQCTFAITTLRQQFISFPNGLEVDRVKQGFQQIAGIPGEIIYFFVQISLHTK
jgi:hypothetical protein